MNIKMLILLNMNINTLSYKLIQRSSISSFTLFRKKTSSLPDINSINNINTINSIYRPKSPLQEEYISTLENPDTKLVFAIGPAGTGKSLFACKYAIQNLKEKRIEKIILTRPLVSVAGEDIGFLPGNLNNKMSIWVQPMIDIFTEHIPKKEITKNIESGVIEITPLLYMRGRTFKNTIIIADEIQNTTPQQLLMLLTRCGDNSKIIITGDLNQSDLTQRNGLQDFIEKYDKSESLNATSELIKIIKFQNKDIQRSDLVKEIIKIYNIQPTTVQHKDKIITTHPETTTTTTTTTSTTSKDNIILKEIQEKKIYSIQNDCAIIPLKDIIKNQKYSL